MVLGAALAEAWSKSLQTACKRSDQNHRNKQGGKFYIIDHSARWSVALRNAHLKGIAQSAHYVTFGLFLSFQSGSKKANHCRFLEKSPRRGAAWTGLRLKAVSQIYVAKSELASIASSQ